MRSQEAKLATFITFVLVICSLCLVSDIVVTRAEEPFATNCLSWPVIFANGSMSFRGDPDFPRFDGASIVIDGTELWYQQDPDNEWQASSRPGVGNVGVDWVDWGDNLESKPWTTNSIIRVETVLFKDTTGEGLIAYEMKWISGLGMDEMWGATTSTYVENLPTVYSSDAYITIQFMGTTGMPVPGTLDWDSSTRTWLDENGDPAGGKYMNEPFSAEVNVKGKVIHGCSWNVRTDSEGEGYYRITMSYGTSTNTNLINAQIVTSSETEAVEGEPQGGVAAVDTEHNLTYIDVQIVKSTGKGGSSGGNGPGGPGGGGSGSGGSGGPGSGGSHSR